MTDTKPESCTTQARRLRHLSVDLRPARRGYQGHTGNTLCGHDAMDEDNTNYWLSRWTTRRISVDALPPCKKCAKAAEKLGSAS